MWFFFDWLHKVLKIEAVKLAVPPSSLEKRAGVENLNWLGEFNVLYALAGGDAHKLESSFHIEYDTAYLYLARKAEDTRITKRMHEILYPEK